MSGSSATDSLDGCNGCQEEGSSAKDSLDGCNGCQEEGRRNYDIMFSGAVERCSTYLAALLCLY